MMALGDVAAKLGLPVFPCGDNKRPVVENGFKAASADPRVIAGLFSRAGASLIGMPTGSTSGLIAIDIDIREEYTGRDWLELNADALPPTRTHKTRSGGLHLIFRVPQGIEIRNSASRIAPGVDVRGEGGYIIIPPSPGYQVADPTEPAEMPRWLIRECGRPEPQPAPVAPAKRAIARAEGGSRYGLAALQNECQAIRGAAFGQQELTLNSASLKIGALAAGGEIDEGIALADLLSAGRDMPSQAGREPWIPTDVEAKIRRAFDDGKGNPRSAPTQRPTASSEPPAGLVYDQAYYDSLERHLPDYADTEAAYVEPIGEARPKEGDKPKVDNSLPLLWFDEIEPVLDAQDFVQGVLLDQGAAVVYGESNAGKTFWATDLALHVAAGKTWSGRRVEQGGVIYCVLEGGIGFRNRVSAWKIEHEMDEMRIPFAAIPSSLNLLNPESDTSRLIAAIKGAAALISIPVKLVVIDTLSRAMAGGNENAPDDMGALVLNMDRIRSETGANVMFIHHSGKDQAKGARGHSLLRAAIDTEIEVVDDNGAKTATLVKQREMTKGLQFAFTLRVVELGANRHAEQVTTCIVDYGDEGQAPDGVRQAPRRRPTGHNKRALEVLSDLIAESGRSGIPGVPSGYQSVPEKWWRDKFYARAMPGAEQATKTRTFSRCGSSLVEEHFVGMNAGRVWIVHQNENKTQSYPDKPDKSTMSGEHRFRNEDGD